MAKIREDIRKRSERRNGAGLAVPAGLLIGMGIGVLYSQLIPGLFIGLGIGFVVMLIIRLTMKN